MQDLENDKTLAYGRIIGNLYVLDNQRLISVSSVSHYYPNKSAQLCNAVQSCNKNSFSVWHNRLGHCCESTLLHLKFVPPKVDINSPCIPCHEAKQKRMPFSNSDSSTSHIFDLIHIDLWGPCKSKTITGSSYFLTILEDFSRSIWTFLLGDKTQVYQTLSNFLAYVSTKFQRSVKTIKTDNGTEFVNQNCQKLFSSLGIIHQKTVSYSPQQLGRVERKHQHLLQISHILMSQSYLPISF